MSELLTTGETAEKVAPAAPASLDAGTEYLVLRRDGDNKWWEVVDTQTSRTPAGAIRQTVGNPLDKDFTEGAYVAVPVRNWNPVNVKPKVTQSVVLEDAK